MIATRRTIIIFTVFYVLLLVAIIFVADLRSTQYVLSPLRWLPFGDKIGHFALMGLLSFWLNLALRAREIKLLRIKYLLGSLIVFVAVTAEEISQIFVRGRTFDWIDLLADWIGIFAFGELARWLINRAARRAKSSGGREQAG